ncbi:hypothetical protein HBH68_146500 [Parastagonospora nodorum]|nr:hypothetical protein HBH68_146500 [Parastagonospora nodorum]
MSDSNETGAASSTSAFTDRELQMLGWAMQSLKTGPPEIDYEKLAGFAGMFNPRSASNAWAKIKGKLLVNPDGAVASPAPKKTGGRKKAAPADGEAATPKKTATPRKRAAKKQDVEGEDASPKKKGRAAKKSDEVVKEEVDEAEDIKVDAPAEVKPELKTEAEEMVQEEV